MLTKKAALTLLAAGLLAFAACSKDGEPPTVMLTAPQEGDTLMRGKVTLKAMASDNKGVSAVSFYVDGQLAGTVSMPPYEQKWDGEEGEHSAYAVAQDEAGNTQTSASVSFYVVPAVAYGENYDNVYTEDYYWKASPIEISGFDDYVVDSIELHAEFYHQYLSDVALALTTEAGFDGSVDTIIHPGDLPGQSGTVKVDHTSRSIFRGEAVNGTWKLWIGDYYSGDDGYLDLWQVWIYCSPAPAAPSGKGKLVVVASPNRKRIEVRQVAKK